MKLENKLTAELEDSSQQSYEELHAKLRNEPTAELNFRAKLRDKPTVELFRACCEARKGLAVKLSASLLGFLQKAILGSLSASLD